MLTAFAVSFGIIFAAEIGDKSQLVALAFSSVYRWWQVLLGITVATLVVHAGSVGLGKVAEDFLPETAVAEGGGLAEEHEDIEVLEIDCAELARMLDRNEIHDLKTLSLAQALRIRHPDLFDEA